MKVIFVNRPIEQPLSGQLPKINIIPDSAMIRDGKPFFVPNFSNDWEYQLVIAVRSTRLGKNISEKFAHRYFDAIALAAKNIPCDLCSDSAIAYAFDGAFILGDWIPIEKISSPYLDINIENQSMRLDISQLEISKTIAAISHYFTLKIGDIIVVATTPLTRKINIDTTASGYIKDIDGSGLKLKFK